MDYRKLHANIFFIFVLLPLSSSHCHVGKCNFACFINYWMIQYVTDNWCCIINPLCSDTVISYHFHQFVSPIPTRKQSLFMALPYTWISENPASICRRMKYEICREGYLTIICHCRVSNMHQKKARDQSKHPSYSISLFSQILPHEYSLKSFPL